MVSREDGALAGQFAPGAFSTYLQTGPEGVLGLHKRERLLDGLLVGLWIVLHAPAVKDIRGRPVFKTVMNTLEQNHAYRAVILQAFTSFVVVGLVFVSDENNGRDDKL